MKAQAYMILAVFLVVAVLGITLLTQKPIEHDSNLQRDFLNIKNELINTIDNSLLDGKDLNVNLENYVAFSEQYLILRDYESEINYKVDGNKVNVYMKIEKGNSYIQDEFNINRVIL